MKALVLLLTLSSSLSLLSVNGNVFETEDAIIVEAAELETNGTYFCTLYVSILYPLFAIEHQRRATSRASC